MSTHASNPAEHGDAKARRGTREEAEGEYQVGSNQIRHEPVPASHQEESRPAAVVRNEEHSGQPDRQTEHQAAGSGGTVRELGDAPPEE